MPLVELLVVAWLPGAVIFRLPWLDRSRRAALPAEERGFWAVVISASISLGVVLALAAGHRYDFARLLAADCGIAAVLALAARFDLRLGPARARPGPGLAIPVLLALFAAWRFLPPSEYIIGGKDPGVYLNAGVQIAQRGTLMYHDPVVAAVPPFARDLFFPADRNQDYYLSVRFMGFFIRDPDSGALVSQFQHAYPASVAVGYGLAGLTGARLAVSFWAVMGVLALYFAGARLFGRAAAAAAAGLLALNVVQLWFARYPNVEVLMQALLFAALLANARAHVDGDRFFGPIAGGLLGLMLFARFDAVIAVAAVVGGLTLARPGAPRTRWPFWATLGTAAALCAWYLLGPMRAYVALPLGFLQHSPRWILLALALAAAALIAFGRRAAASATMGTALPVVLAVAVPALAAYAFVWRQPGGRLAEYDAHALRTFTLFYLTLPGLIAALLGYVLGIRRAFWRDPAFFLAITAYACIFFYKIRIVPEHFWMARRFVPMVLPGALLLASAAAVTGERGRLLLVRAVRWPIGLVFLGLLALAYARAARPISDHVEYAGIIPRIEALARQVGDDDLLVVESRDAGSDAHVFALPLADIYARNVLVLNSAAPDKATFGAFLARMQARYRRVLFLGGGGTDLLSRRWSLTPIASDRFQIPEYESAWNAYPRSVRHKEFDYSVYAFGAPPQTPPPVDLDIGIDDDLNVVRFHAKETTDGRTFRWSQRQSFVIVNHVGAGDRTLALWMGDGGRPPAAPPADVHVLIGERELGVVRVAGGFREYDVPLPADEASDLAKSGEPVRITLRTDTWNPLKVLGTPDDRDLGIMLDRVAIR